MSDTTASVEQPNLAEQAAPSAVIVASAVVGLPELLEKSIIKKDQDGIRRNIIKIDAAVHANAVQCLMHAEKHGDTSLMRRLLVDIIDAKSGYRRQGVIGWMRMFSPMELSGDVIKLTGTVNGERRPWRIEEANKTPFTSIAQLNEQIALRPIFKDNLTSKVERALKEYRTAVENTLVEQGQPAKPKDPKKPFYNGIHLDKMDSAFDEIELILSKVQSWGDSSKDVYAANETLIKAQLELTDAK